MAATVRASGLKRSGHSPGLLHSSSLSPSLSLGPQQKAPRFVSGLRRKSGASSSLSASPQASNSGPVFSGPSPSPGVSNKDAAPAPAVDEQKENSVQPHPNVGSTAASPLLCSPVPPPRRGKRPSQPERPSLPMPDPASLSPGPLFAVSPIRSPAIDEETPREETAEVVITATPEDDLPRTPEARVSPGGHAADFLSPPPAPHIASSAPSALVTPALDRSICIPETPAAAVDISLRIAETPQQASAMVTPLKSTIKTTVRATDAAIPFPEAAISTAAVAAPSLSAVAPAVLSAPAVAASFTADHLAPASLPAVTEASLPPLFAAGPRGRRGRAPLRAALPLPLPLSPPDPFFSSPPPSVSKKEEPDCGSAKQEEQEDVEPSIPATPDKSPMKNSSSLLLSECIHPHDFTHSEAQRLLSQMHAFEGKDEPMMFSSQQQQRSPLRPRVYTETLLTPSPKVVAMPDPVRQEETKQNDVQQPKTPPRLAQQERTAQVEDTPAPFVAPEMPRVVPAPSKADQALLPPTMLAQAASVIAAAIPAPPSASGPTPPVASPSKPAPSSLSSNGSSPLHQSSGSNHSSPPSSFPLSMPGAALSGGSNGRGRVVPRALVVPPAAPAPVTPTLQCPSTPLRKDQQHISPPLTPAATHRNFESLFRALFSPGDKGLNRAKILVNALEREVHRRPGVVYGEVAEHILEVLTREPETVAQLQFSLSMMEFVNKHMPAAPAAPAVPPPALPSPKHAATSAPPSPLASFSAWKQPQHTAAASVPALVLDAGALPHRGGKAFRKVGKASSVSMSSYTAAIQASSVRSIHSFASPHARSVAQQLAEDSMRDAAAHAQAQRDHSQEELARRHAEMQRKKAEKLASAARIEAAARAHQDALRQEAPLAPMRIAATTPAKPAFSIFANQQQQRTPGSASSARSAAGAAVTSPSTRSRLVQPAPLALATSAAPMTPSREYPNRQLSFATPESERRPNAADSRTDVVQRLSEVSEGLEAEAAEAADHHGEFRPLALPVAPLPQLSDPPPLERPSPFPMDAALIAAAAADLPPPQHEHSQLEQEEGEDSFLRFLRVKMEGSDAPGASEDHSRKRRHSLSPPAAAPAPPAAAAAVSPPLAQQRSARAFLTPSSTSPAPAAHQSALQTPAQATSVREHGSRSPFVLPPTPQVWTSPFGTSAPSSAASSSSSSNAAMRTPSPAQRRHQQVPETEAPASTMISRKRAHGSDNLETDATASKRPRHSSPSTDAENDADAPPADPANPMLHSINPHRQLAAKLNRRAKEKDSSSAAAAAPKRVHGAVARGRWGTSADGTRFYICLADGKQYSGQEAHAKAAEDARNAATRKGLRFDVAAPGDVAQENDDESAADDSANAAAVTPARASGAIDLISPPSPGRNGTLVSASAAETHLKSSLHSLSGWSLPQSIISSYSEVGIRTLYDWQADCLSQPGVLDGSSNLVYSASTSGGKTLVAEILMLQRILLTDAAAARAHSNTLALSGQSGAASNYAGRKVMLVLPYVALVDEKCSDLQRKLARAGFCIQAYHAQQSASGSEGANALRDMNRWSPEVDVAIVVIEKAPVLLASLEKEHRMGELAAVVVDELHMLSSSIGGVDESKMATGGRQGSSIASGNSSNRGFHLELLLTKIRQWNATHPSTLAAASASSSSSPLPSPIALPIQIIGLSATLPNMDLFRSWLAPCRVYSTDFRPVALREFVVHAKVLYEKRSNPEFESLRRAAADAEAQGLPPPALPPRTVPKFLFERVRSMELSKIAEETRKRKNELDQMSQANSAVGIRAPAAGIAGATDAAAAAESQQEQKMDPDDLDFMVDFIEEVTLPTARRSAVANAAAADGSTGAAATARNGAGGVLIFCSSKVKTEECARLVAKTLRRRTKVRRSGITTVGVHGRGAKAHGGGSSASKQRTLDAFVTHGGSANKSPGRADGLLSDEAQRELTRSRRLLLQDLDSATGCLESSRSLQRSILEGVCFHHAGLTGDERKLVEDAFRSGVLVVLCCTSTLAAGVNLPARRVLFHGIHVGPSLLTVTQYRQMSGRAGRAGHCGGGGGAGGEAEEGSSIVLVPRGQAAFDNIRSIINQDLPQLKSALDADFVCSQDMLVDPSAESNNAAAPNAVVRAPSPGGAPRYVNPYLAHGILECLAATPNGPATNADGSANLPPPHVSRSSVSAFLGHTLLGHQRMAEEVLRSNRARERAELRAGGPVDSPPTLAIPANLQVEVNLALDYLSVRKLLEPLAQSAVGLVGRATLLGQALVESGLGPRDGLRIYEELVLARTQGLSLSTPLHLCWLLTPEPGHLYTSYNLAEERAKWQAMLDRWGTMHRGCENGDKKCVAEKDVCMRLPVPQSMQQQQKQQLQQQQQQQRTQQMPPPPVIASAWTSRARAAPAATRIAGSSSFLPPAAPLAAAAPLAQPASLADMSFLERQVHQSHEWILPADRVRASDPLLRAYVRLWHAFLLLDLLDESVSLEALVQRSRLERGELHQRLTQATLQCGQLLTLCERLGWRDLALVLSLLRERTLHAGAGTELLSLMRLPGLKLSRARTLHAAGFDSVEKIATHGSAQRLYDIFAAATPYKAASRPVASARPGAAAHAAVAKQQRQEREEKEQEAARQVRNMQQAVEIYSAACKIVRQQQRMASA